VALGTGPKTPTVKVCLYRTRPRLGVREGMDSIKQAKVVYIERESKRGTGLHFVLFTSTPPSRVRGRVLYKQIFKVAILNAY